MPSLFSRKAGPGRTGSSISPAFVAEIEAFGRFSWDPQANPTPGDLEFRAYQMAQSNRADFLTHMATIATQHGGWTAYGAERLLVSVIGGDLTDPEYSTVMRAALTFLRSNNVPDNRLSGYEWTWWVNNDGRDLT